MAATGSDLWLTFDDLPLVADRRGKAFLISNIEARIKFFSRSSWFVEAIACDQVALDREDDRDFWSRISNAIDNTQREYVEKQIDEARADAA